MRKKYSDPLMFPAVILSTNLTHSQEGESPGDEVINPTKLNMNGRSAALEDDNAIQLVPAEAATEAASDVPVEDSSVAESIIPEVNTVLDSVVGDGQEDSSIAESTATIGE